jgi:hypothetical protein
LDRWASPGLIGARLAAEVAGALAVVAERMTHWRTEGRRFAVALEWDNEAFRLSAASMTPEP